MKVTIVIPSYWSRACGDNWREGDAVYDHPTPLDSECTLLRTLRSIDVLEEKDFELVIIAVATAKDIEAKIEDKITSQVKSLSLSEEVKVSVFGHSKLEEIHNIFSNKGKKAYIDLLRLQGYSNIRNLCIFIPHILRSDVAILIDDDEVFEDPQFLVKAKEFIGRNVGGKTVKAVAGYYLQPDGDFHVKKPFHSWMKYWDIYSKMNEAFDKIIRTEPRLKETSFVFGGNMVIHRDLFTVIPFDPNVPRGEDIDYLINAKMFGFTFFLDNQLSIKHLPPPKTHPTWMQLRQDIYRFLYERAKINKQRDVKGMTRIYSEDLDPYPGSFLKKDLEEKIEKSSRLLSEEYLAQGDMQSSKETLNNITLSKKDAAPNYDPFQNLCDLQRRWKELMEYTAKSQIRSNIKEIIE